MTSQQVLLPNSGASVGSVRVHPVALFTMCDAYLRRSEKQERVIGTLLGSVEGNVLEVKSCYVVPHTESSEQVGVECGGCGGVAGARPRLYACRRARTAGAAGRHPSMHHSTHARTHARTHACTSSVSTMTPSQLHLHVRALLAGYVTPAHLRAHLRACMRVCVLAKYRAHFAVLPRSCNLCQHAATALPPPKKRALPLCCALPPPGQR